MRLLRPGDCIRLDGLEGAIVWIDPGSDLEQAERYAEQVRQVGAARVRILPQVVVEGVRPGREIDFPTDRALTIREICQELLDASPTTPEIRSEAGSIVEACLSQAGC